MNNTDLAAALESRLAELTRDREIAGDVIDNRHYGALSTCYEIVINDLRGIQAELAWLSVISTEWLDKNADVATMCHELDDFVAATAFEYESEVEIN